jgi:four helix bundle protein
MYKSFRDMPVWQQSMAIAESVFELTGALPRKEDYGLTSQIRRSALSISANIAEGFGRGHAREKIQFYMVARGSIAETQNHVEYGRRVHYIGDEEAKGLDQRLEELMHDLNKIIAMLKRQC